MSERERAKNDYPSYGDEYVKCREFLQNYSEGGDNLPYQVQLVRTLLSSSEISTLFLTSLPNSCLLNFSLTIHAVF